MKIIFENLQEIDDFLDFIDKKPKSAAKEAAPAKGKAEKPKATSGEEDAPVALPAVPAVPEAPELEPVRKVEPVAGQETKHTETDLKLLLTKKLKAGKKESINKMYEEYAVTKLSELLKKHPDKIDELYAKAEAF